MEKCSFSQEKNVLECKRANQKEEQILQNIKTENDSTRRKGARKKEQNVKEKELWAK